MPPENTPNVGVSKPGLASRPPPFWDLTDIAMQDTRPSTPPTYPPNPSLSSHPYLQQLEEAISTPVPDLASTLTTPETRPRHSTGSEAWDDRPILHMSRDDSASAPTTTTRESDLAASLDRMQSELDRWQTERNRLRTFLHNQQSRQSILEQQNSRLREEHSRLVDEHSRLSSSITGEAPSRPPLTTILPNQDQSALSNLATAIAEVGRDSYATRGSAPERQRLYDWAAPHSTASDTRTQGTGSNEAAAETRDNSARHRELERALRNYRVARDALRANPAPNLGTVPTASALRAYWSEESNEEPQSTSNHRAPFALSQFVEQHRRERQRRLAQADYHTATRSTEPSVTPSSLSNSTALKERIRNTIHYLSKLRTTSAEGGLELARFLDLDALYECEDTNAPSDLPLLVDSLPLPQPSSWLAPGMTWHGLQSTDRDQRGPTLLSSTLRRMRQREYIGRAMSRRGIAEAQNAAASMLSAGDASTEPDTDRYVSSLMRDTDGRWGFGHAREHAELPGSSTDSNARYTATQRTAEPSDHWPVTVTIHSVDYSTMEISGTMRASQIPDRTAGVDGRGRSMESYFQGEIIDFRNHSLETEGLKRGYKVGGVDVDARYWARLGPFKQAIRKHTSTWDDGDKWEDKLKTGDTKYWDMLRTADRENRELEADQVMMRCLANQRWLRDKLGTEWVLMRWKEKCFVDPILNNTTTTSNHANTSSTDNSSSNDGGDSSRPVLRGGNSSDSSAATWGLTISGFYYVALNRQTGQIDGLYYDPGSQPYQSLRMAPEGMALAPSTAEGEREQQQSTDGVRGSRHQHADAAVGSGSESGNGKRNANAEIRRWFPAVEFR